MAPPLTTEYIFSWEAAKAAICEEFNLTQDQFESIVSTAFLPEAMTLDCELGTVPSEPLAVDPVLLTSDLPPPTPRNGLEEEELSVLHARQHESEFFSWD